jgi:hypothetical protein
MTERPSHPPQPEQQLEHAWDPEVIGTLLDAVPEPIRDGHYFIIGNAERDDVRLELYPTGVARLSTTETEMTCFGLGPPIVSGDQLILRSANPEIDQLQLAISASGVVSLLLQHHLSDVAERPENAVPPSTPPDAHPGDQSPNSALETPRHDDAQQPATAPPNPEQKEKDERIELVGRIDSVPRFKRSPKQNTFICEFSLVVELEDGSERTEKVVLFGAKAHQVENMVDRAIIQPGNSVRVIGYQREYNLVPQVYGHVVQRVENE